MLQMPNRQAECETLFCLFLPFGNISLVVHVLMVIVLCLSFLGGIFPLDVAFLEPFNAFTSSTVAERNKLFYRVSQNVALSPTSFYRTH